MDLNFKVNTGDSLCIVGENGSGKSTLVKVLASLKNIDSGELTFGDGLKQREIGYLPQKTDAQKDFPASVREVVLSGCLNARGILPFYSKADRAKARENIAALGLTPLVRRSFRELSGGQQQRVLLARALCSAKKLLLLDEPFAGLDPIASADLYHIIKTLNESGITIIMVSHDVKSAVFCASHILHLHTHQLYFGDTAGYIKSEAGKRFLGGAINA
jgi:zinc transport system ATP-binding protein